MPSKQEAFRCDKSSSQYFACGTFLSEAHVIRPYTQKGLPLDALAGRYCHEDIVKDAHTQPISQEALAKTGRGRVLGLSMGPNLPT